ncbi:Eukaryotic translation initiation factor 3 subunit F {ECO:0000255/HAMAP-Rule:MF_03005} Short=eIF3f {ECO:0000255/HAMAP-Rule:MF_03005} [Serendipita indica DSM 11827]|nr:Eukaryotic translation initiation factor 3 subunit F {ECO:0000255/HAMAP-Rule:MF_03005} Short=eIF3f {ECO:0000255/HAMAP-Rule:MF_03005} [Serendipita indica DSM 11827]
MSLGSLSSALYINAPGSQKSPAAVRLNSTAVFTILDHHLRKRDDQKRVIGTLMGIRTENDVEIRSAFAVLHSESADQVAIDEEYFQNMFEVTQKVQPREQIIGWYSTGPELNNFSALFQNYYSHQTAPHQAVHLTVDTGEKSGELSIKAYLGSPMGVSAKPDNCSFIPIPVLLRHMDIERPGLNLLKSAAEAPNHTTSVHTDLQILEQSLLEVISMIERVQNYVQGVIDGDLEGDASIGRYLLDTLNTTTEGLEKGKLESLFNIHVQDNLMISYLANLVRSQAEVSTRLTLVT